VQLTVSLEDRTVSVGDLTVPFQVDDYTRWRLMEGLDDISLTLRNESAITEFEARRPTWMPTTTPLEAA
jgi:3-isopropylmalate/(R)-2-methylmalate dehydratase small subunit